MRTGERGIVILGFMGAGKTTVARALAQRLNRELIDLDRSLAESEARSVTEIIETEGESRFREFETKALVQALRLNPGGVIALGGGTWTIDRNRKLLEQAGAISVWLDVPFEVCWQRIHAATDERPLAPDESTARKLFNARRSCYALAQFRVDGNADPDAAQVADLIVDQLLSGTG